MVDTELLYVCVRGYEEEYAGRKYWNCTGTEGLCRKQVTKNMKNIYRHPKVLSSLLRCTIAGMEINKRILPYSHFVQAW